MSASQPQRLHQKRATRPATSPRSAWNTIAGGSRTIVPKRHNTSRFDHFRDRVDLKSKVPLGVRLKSTRRRHPRVTSFFVTQIPVVPRSKTDDDELVVNQPTLCQIGKHPPAPKTIRPASKGCMVEGTPIFIKNDRGVKIKRYFRHDYGVSRPSTARSGEWPAWLSYFVFWVLAGAFQRHCVCGFIVQFTIIIISMILVFLARETNTGGRWGGMDCA